MSSLGSWFTSIFTGNYPLVSVKSRVDGRTYKVRDMADKQEAADLLAKVRIRLGKLCDQLVAKYPNKPQVQRMQQNFKADPDRFLEATPDAKHTSYSVNKGETIHLCLRQRNGPDESLVSEDVMMFVGIHELAHTITKSIGHEPEFWNNFGWLLREAEALGLYEPQDFKAHPVAYCGVSITDQPRYDPARDESNLVSGSGDSTSNGLGNILQIGKLFSR
jgi:hypothetical protein